ncbi:MAG TPA: 3'(2'),5'-bisphosphate nucleotidase CysQ [Anaeromyxobacteraceae bacterium]|nr:3'(2'),5'-bisphosphate nucleotidase CysQ [Anaeromyxobacteraceae bacterium]
MAEPGGALARELAVASALARAAGEVLLRHRAAGVTAGAKASGEVVTAADLEADRVIRAGLAAAFPGDALLSEETPDDPARLGCDRVWIVDPIDATSDYAAGGREHAVSIGLAIRGEAVLGVVHDPATGESFAGVVGEGAWLGGRAARVSDAADAHTAALTVSRKEWGRGLDRRCQGMRVRPVSSVAYKMARVGVGLDDGMFSDRPRKEWDVCAGVAIVLAGGGRVTLLDGAPVAFNRASVRLPMGIVVAGPALHGALREELLRRGVGGAGR